MASLGDCLVTPEHLPRFSPERFGDRRCVRPVAIAWPDESVVGGEGDPGAAEPHIQAAVEGPGAMTQQDAFIARVRAALVDGIPPNPVRPLPDTPNDPIEYTADLGDVVAAFERAAGVAGAEIVGHPDDRIDAIVRRVIDEVAPTLIAVSGDPECDGIAARLAAEGHAVAPSNDLAALASADLGITGAVAGVALTGSLVVDSMRAGGRLASLLPRVHLAMLSTTRIMATPGDVWRTMPDRYPDGLPSNIVFITGPSRSADIELEITEGVHGPQRVLIALTG